jgi:hypothetical protein
VPSNQPPGIYPVTLSVNDAGEPPLSDWITFNITVQALATTNAVTPPLLHSVFCVGAQTSFTFDSIPGRAYRVFYTDDLSASTWRQLGPDFVSANRTVSLTDPVSAPQRFYRVYLLE